MRPTRASFPEELTPQTVEYDKTGDILSIGKTKCYAEQESQELDFGVIARLNPQTHELENLEILFVSSRIFPPMKLSSSHGHDPFIFAPYSMSKHNREQ